MARILRGDICWADLDPAWGRVQAGRRPVLVLSQDIFNDHSGTVIAVALTSRPQKAGFPLTLELSTANMPKKAWAKIGQMQTLSVRRLGKRISRASPEELDRIIEGLFEIIGA